MDGSQVSRRFASPIDDRPDDGAKALGFEPATTSPHRDHETLYDGMYRRRREMMCNGEAVR